MKSFAPFVVLLIGCLTFAFSHPEHVQTILESPGLKIGDIAPQKPSGMSHGEHSISSNISTPFSPSQDLEVQDSSSCCDCEFEAHGLGFKRGGGIDFGDDTPTTINSWITDPYNNLGCGGHSYTAFNLYGLGYGRWDYDHANINFYIQYQYNHPGGKISVQWDKPLVDTTKSFSDFSYGTQLFEAYIIDVKSSTVLDSCPCFSRKSYSTWACAPEENCCLGAECHERLNFQCGPCGTLKG